MCRAGRTGLNMHRRRGNLDGVIVDIAHGTLRFFKTRLRQNQRRTRLACTLVATSIIEE